MNVAYGVKIVLDKCQAVWHTSGMEDTFTVTGFDSKNDRLGSALPTSLFTNACDIAHRKMDNGADHVEITDKFGDVIRRYGV